MYVCILHVVSHSKFRQIYNVIYFRSGKKLITNVCKIIKNLKVIGQTLCHIQATNQIFLLKADISRNSSRIHCVNQTLFLQEKPSEPLFVLLLTVKMPSSSNKTKLVSKANCFACFFFVFSRGFWGQLAAVAVWFHHHEKHPDWLHNTKSDWKGSELELGKRDVWYFQTWNLGDPTAPQG